MTVIEGKGIIESETPACLLMCRTATLFKLPFFCVSIS